MQDVKKEIRSRIGIGKASFTSMNKVLTSRNIDMALRIRVLKCYVWSILLLYYGCEAWSLSSVIMKKREDFETWLYRKILRISWKDGITKDEDYRRMGTVNACLLYLHSLATVFQNGRHLSSHRY